MNETNSDSPKAATISDVARAAGVTTATVSRTLSGKRHGSVGVRAAVFQAVRELGYTPNPHAQRLKTGRLGNHVDLLSVHLDSGMDARKAQLIQGLLLQRGYSAPLHAYGWGADNESAAGQAEQKAIVAALRRQKPRALVCDMSGLGTSTIEELRFFADEGTTLALYGYKALSLPCDQVLFDSRASRRVSVQHLAELGHRRIGMAVMTRSRHNTPTHTAFRRALDERGLKFRAEWLFPGVPRSSHADVEEAGRAVFEWFMAMPKRSRPTALIVNNDYAALRLMTLLHHAGIVVPRDLSIIGHDDRPLGRDAWVPLSSVTHPADEIAQHVVALLEERLSGYDGEARTVVVSGELKIRSSTAAPRA